MLIGEMADNILARLDATTIASKKLDRRNCIIEFDIIRSKYLSIGVYSGTFIAGSKEWQYNIGNDVKELPDILFLTQTMPVVWNKWRGCNMSVMPSEFVMFKNKNGIRSIKGRLDRTAETETGARVDFVAQKAGSGVDYGLLESAALSGGIGYEIEMRPGTPGTLFYNNMQAGQFCDVLITYLPKLSGLSEDDMLPMDDSFAKMCEDETVMAFMYQKGAQRDKTEGE